MTRRDRLGLSVGVGQTPLVDLSALEGIPAGVSLLAKLESANPNGSLKDRSVERMLAGALQGGHLGGGRRLLDSSSGNAGIAYAAFGARLGIAITLVIPGNASKERVERIRAHGAEVVSVDPLEGYDFAIAEAQRLARTHPDRYWYCNQYGNDDNWRAHFDGTGEEILRQFDGRLGHPPDAFVCGVGTGGSLTGIARRLLEANPGLRVVAIVPERFPGIEGLKPLDDPGDFVPPILDRSIIHEQVEVTSEQAVSTCALLARRGLFVGPSSGAYVHGALALVRTGRYRSVATLLCDTGERYMSTGMWSRASALSDAEVGAQ